MTTEYDAIIIGSGFGGAVTACRLAEAGYKVLILERGRRWEVEDYPRRPGDAWSWSEEHPERENGWIDFRVYRKMAIIQGAAVGGGSHIYSGITVDAKPDQFDEGWPPEINYEILEPHYKTVAEMLAVEKVPENQLPARTRLMREAAQQAGFGNQFDRLEMATAFNEEWRYDLEDPFDAKHSRPFDNKHGLRQGTCIHLGTCNIGCDVRARNTLDLNYLALAEKHGARVWPLHLVRFIRPLDEDDGYRVHFDRIENQSFIPGSMSARIVIVAAGSLGSTELMLRCRDEYQTLPRLSRYVGRNWSPNGDVISTAFYPQRLLIPSRGPTTNGVIDFLGPNNLDGNHFFIEDAGFPDLLRLYLEEKAEEPVKGVFVRSLLRTLNRAAQHSHTHNLDERRPTSHLMPWFAQGRDAGNGQLRLRRKWWIFGARKLDLKWDVQQSERLINAIMGMHKRLTDETGGIFMEPSYWTLDRYMVTTHPLGGCNLGTTSENGVVDHKGEVFGYRNLYIVDGSIIPEAIGANPSKTIAALAERIAAILIGEGR